MCKEDRKHGSKGKETATRPDIRNSIPGSNMVEEAKHLPWSCKITLWSLHLHMSVCSHMHTYIYTK